MTNSEYFNSRHTIRCYQEKDIPRSKITDMLVAASHAPNTGNMQWYSVIVSQEEGQKKLLSPAHFNQPCVLNASAVLTFCIDLRRFEHWCKINKADSGFNNFQSFVAAIIDTSIFAQQFCTVAEMEGYGTCYLGTTAYNAPKIAEILHMPKRVVPVITVTLGVPLESELNKPTIRLPIEAVMHSEKYHEPSDEDICRWYKQIEIESQHFVEENSKETLAQVFTDVRYPRESAEFFSKVYYDFLKENEF